MCKPILISFAFHSHFYFTSNAFYRKWRERNDLKATAAASSLIMHWKYYNILSLQYIPIIVICKGRIVRLRVTWKDERKNYNFWFACLKSVEAGKLLLWNVWARFTFHTLIILYTKTYFCTEMYDRYGSLPFH